jgi:hypothetical protein
VRVLPRMATFFFFFFFLLGLGLGLAAITDIDRPGRPCR